MDENKSFTSNYDKYSIKYSKYLFLTLIGSFWGLNKFYIKDFKTCYDRLVFGSVSAIISIIFFYFYVVFPNTLSLFERFSFEEIEHLKHLIFGFFIPIFLILIIAFAYNLIKDLSESINEVNRYNHRVKKVILKGQTEKLEKLEQVDNNVYKQLFNSGSLFGTYNAYIKNTKKHIILCILPSLVSILLIINLLVDLFCFIMYFVNFLLLTETTYMIYSVSANISLSILSFLLFNLIPIWLCFNLLIIFTDYKKIKNIKTEKRF